jgi:hypothetical protein
MKLPYIGLLIFPNDTIVATRPKENKILFEPLFARVIQAASVKQFMNLMFIRFN